jgi:orotate phosphoribosyltransferase-like protein
VVLLEASLSRLHIMETAKIALCQSMASAAASMGNVPRAAAFENAALLAGIALIAVDAAMAAVVASATVEADALAIITASAIAVAAAEAYSIGTDVAVNESQVAA